MKKEELDKLLNECKELAEQTEPFQIKVKAKHARLKRLIIGHGGQKNTPPYTQKPSMERSKSAPPIGELKFKDLSKKSVWTKIDPELLRQNKKEAEEETNINDELYDILDKSYSKIGGHAEFKKPSDLPSDYTGWSAVDVDDDPGPDALRVWKIDPQGNVKLTAGGSDGSPMGKDVYLRKTVEMLNTPGTYAEMSDAIAHVMITRYGVPSVNDEEFVRKLLQGKQIKWIGASPTGKYAGYNGWYSRDIGGTSHNKIILGYPAGYTPEKKNINIINIKEAINPEKAPNRGTKKLSVFDFDDTLVMSNSKVFLINASGERIEMTPENFAKYQALPKDQFDFSQFKTVIEPKPIRKMVDKFRKAISDGHDTAILTARNSDASKPIKKLLSNYGITPTEIITLGDNSPSKKADYIAMMAGKNKYSYIEYYDDSKKNVDAAAAIKDKFPNVEFRLYYVVHGIPISAFNFDKVVKAHIKEGLFGNIGSFLGLSKPAEPKKQQRVYEDYGEVHPRIYVGAAPIDGGKIIKSVLEDKRFGLIFIMSTEVAALLDANETEQSEKVITEYAINDTTTPSDSERNKLKEAANKAKEYLDSNSGGVLFTCAMGRNRSAAAACLTIIKHDTAVTAEAAIEKVINIRGPKALTLRGQPHVGFLPIIKGTQEKSLPA